MNTMQHEQLFTDLTPEQAAVVEGGFQVCFYNLKAVKAGADADGVDDAYLTVFPSPGKLWQGQMETGDVAKINKGFRYITKDLKSARLFDKDTGADGDDLIGSVPLYRRTNGKKIVSLQGSGSKYLLEYSVS